MPKGSGRSATTVAVSVTWSRRRRQKRLPGWTVGGASPLPHLKNVIAGLRSARLLTELNGITQSLNKNKKQHLSRAILCNPPASAGAATARLRGEKSDYVWFLGL